MDALEPVGGSAAKPLNWRQRPHVPHLNPRKRPQIAGYSSETAKHRAREDSNLQPDRYERAARLDVRPLLGLPARALAPRVPMAAPPRRPARSFLAPRPPPPPPPPPS